MWFFSNYRFFYCNLAMLSLLALVIGAVAEYFFHIKPCILCIYQRYIFIGITILSVMLAAFSSFKKTLWIVLVLIIISGISLGTYQVGVEKHWWAGPEICSNSNPMQGLENLTNEEAIDRFTKNLDNNAIVVRCDQVNWHIFGVSATIWTTLFYVFLLILAVIERWIFKRF
jgi:disulfide bond formation protein DsbB